MEGGGGKGENLDGREMLIVFLLVNLRRLSCFSPFLSGTMKSSDTEA